MKLRPALLLGTLLLTSVASAADKKEEKVNFEEHILPILENKCLNCHNPDEAKGGLDLSTYGAMLNGGSGGKVVETEDPGGSRLYSLMAHTEEPYMPPRKPKAPDEELALIAKWINGGLLETSSSKAKKSDKPKMDMTLITSTGKPDGPAAMPEHVIIQPEIVTERPNAVPALAHSPWAPIVAVAGQKQVILYHSEDFDVLGILPYPEGFPQSLSFSSNGSLLQAGGGRGGKAGNVVAWDVKTGERVIEVGREFDIVLGSDISPDHRHVVMGGPGKIFKIWDTVSGEQIAAVKKHPDWLLTADYSPDGVLLATGGRNSGLYIWEGATGLEFYTLKGHTKAITDLGWRPDSNILASISEDGVAMLWEMNEGKQIKKWTAHSGGGLAIDFSPDGSMIASAGRDKTVKLWKADGAAIRTIKASDDIVMSVAFTHDNKRVISGDYNGVIKVWNVADGTELALLDANPPTIDKQIEYAEKRITELNSKIPALEKSIATARDEAKKAKEKLSLVAKQSSELAGKKAARDKEIASLSGALKSLTDETNKFKGLVSQNTSLMQQRTAERVKAEKELQNAKTEEEKWKQTLAKQNLLLKQAADAANALKKVADSPVFDDPKKQSAYIQARDALNQATARKNQADKDVSLKAQETEKLKAQLDVHSKALAQFEAEKTKAVNNVNAIKERFDEAVYARQQADEAVKEASAEGAAPPVEVVNAQKAAMQKQMALESEYNKAIDAQNQAAAKWKIQKESTDKIKQSFDAANKYLLAARENQKSINATFAQAGTTLKPFLQEGGERLKAVAKANAEIPARIAAYQKIDAEQKNHQKLLSQATAKIAQWEAKVKSARAAEAAARGDMEDANSTLIAKSKALSETGAKLNLAKAEIAKLQKELEAVAKQKEAQAKAVTAVSSKESEVKKSIEVAKVDLEKSKFLAQKFKAAAINFEAKLESEELDDMSVELDDMLDEETEAKKELQSAVASRQAAEKTLEEAKKTVVTGQKKLKETTTSVLDRALALIAGRAAANLREEVAVEVVEEKPVEVAALETPAPTDEPTTSLPEEADEEVEVVEVLSSTTAEKSPDEINAEIEAIQKRLEDLSKSIAEAYTEADKTKKTVVSAAEVAKKTPPVIAERAKIEQSKAQLAKSIEQQRKAQETTVEEQKKLISELKKKYLESLPERK